MMRLMTASLHVPSSKQGRTAQSVSLGRLHERLHAGVHT